MALSDGVTEEAYIAPVVTSQDKVAIGAAADAVDVRAISTSGEDAINVPRELDGLGCPGYWDGVRGTAGVLSDAAILTDVPEEELIGLASRSKELGMVTPVHALDGGRVCVTSSSASPGSGGVDSDLVIVRSDRKPFAAGTEGHNLDPLGRFLEFLVHTLSMNVHDTIVSSNDILTVGSTDNRTGALGSGLASDAGSSTSLGLYSAGRNSEGFSAFASLNVPDLDLVVVSRSHDLVAASVSKTPDFSVVVTFHNSSLGGFVIKLEGGDAAIAGSYEHVSIQVVDRTNHASEGDGLLGSHRGAVPDHNVAVFASGEEHVVDAADGGDVASLVSGNYLVKLVVLPDKDRAVLSTSVESTFFIRCDNTVRHAGKVSVISTVDTFVFNFSSVEIPEFDVLRSGGTEDVRSRSS